MFGSCMRIPCRVMPPCIAVMISGTMVNRQTDSIWSVILLAQTKNFAVTHTSSFAPLLHLPRPQSPPLLAANHGRRSQGERGDKSPRIQSRGTLMQIVPLRFCHRYKKERSVAFKICQNPFSAGALPCMDPAGGAHDSPSDPLVGQGGDTPPIPHPTRHQPTFGACHASPRIPARSTPVLPNTF